MSYTTLEASWPTLKEQHQYDFFNKDLGLQWYSKIGQWPTNSAVPMAPVKYNECEPYVPMGKLLNQRALGDPKYTFHTAQLSNTRAI